MNQPLTIAQCATLACIWEATIPKPGNVHRGADFEDLSYTDFLLSAVAVGPVLETAAAKGVGRCVLEAVARTRQMVGTNTNLGSLLLLAPLCAVPRERPLGEGVRNVLQNLLPSDAHNVYEAIRLANAGGLGEVESMDVREQPPDDLLAAMRAAAGRDLVARQYAEDFQQVLSCAAPWIREGLANRLALGPAVRHAFIRLLHEFPDSLIGRKCGPQTAIAAAGRAGQILAAGSPGEEAYEYAMGDLDFWLRSDGHRRNPGTTADMIAAGLFVLLRDGIIEFPVRME
ncbi:MAG: triphosphoribosyl-dephospho-CoA synthase [Planctomycetes bacterium]|nr:triphosphoribosyl-dephospho-CoA synthase [Planctomycetota bacterium]